MKKYILPCLLLFITIAACNQNKTTSTKDYTADTIVYKMVSYGDKDTSGAASVYVDYPEFQEESLNYFVNELITSTPLGDGAQNIKAVADSFINEYLHLKAEIPEVNGYEWTQTLSVGYQNKNLINFKHLNWAYTGGAHGGGTIIYHNLAKPFFIRISLDDLFKPGYEEKLTEIAERIFRKDEEISANEPLSGGYFFENSEFSLNNNFLITPDGLLFTYNIYEIKPYVEGMTDLLIPYNEIKDLIMPDGILSDFY